MFASMLAHKQAGSFRLIHDVYGFSDMQSWFVYAEVTTHFDEVLIHDSSKLTPGSLGGEKWIAKF